MYDPVFNRWSGRRFEIFVSLHEGFDGETIHAAKEVEDVFSAWLEDRLLQGLPVMSASFSSENVIFGWRTNEGSAEVLEEPNVKLTLATHPEFTSKLSDTDVNSVVRALASHLGVKFGQTRIYVYESVFQLSIFQKPDSVAPTQENPQQ